MKSQSNRIVLVTRPGPLQLSPLPRVQLQRPLQPNLHLRAQLRPLQQRRALPDQLPQKAQPKRKHLPRPRRQLRLKLRLNLSPQFQGELQGVQRRPLRQARQKHQPRPLQRLLKRHRLSHSHLHPQRVPRPQQRSKRRLKQRLQQRPRLPQRPKLVCWLERLQRLSMELLLQKHQEELKGKLALEVQPQVPQVPQRPRNRKSPLLPPRRPRAPRRLPWLHSSQPRRLQP